METNFLWTCWYTMEQSSTPACVFSFLFLDFFCVLWPLDLLNGLTSTFNDTAVATIICDTVVSRKRNRGLNTTRQLFLRLRRRRPGVLKHGCFSNYSMFTYQSDSNYTSDGRILVYTTWQGGTQPKFCLALKGTNLPGAYVRVCRCRGC